MKATTLRILVGVAVPLILTGSVDAGFTGISTTSKPNEFGLLVVNVYAVFDRPGEDHMLLVAGTPNAPLNIQVIGGTFFQHPFGSINPPPDVLVQAYPSVAYDTFVTIGVKCVGDPPCQPQDFMTQTNHLAGAFTPSQVFTTIEGWAVTPAHAQGNPFDAVNSFPGDGRILIGQFSTLDGVAIQGTMLLGFIRNNVSTQLVVSFFHVPTPGALAMMGVAGLIGTRRRRRHRRD